MALFVAGHSHKNAAVELREQLAVDEDKLRELLRDMAGAGVVREAIILSTCNRGGGDAVADVPGEARATALRQLCRPPGGGPPAGRGAPHTHAQGDAGRQPVP